MVLRVIVISAVLMSLGAGAGAQISDDVVKIGVLNDQSGLYSDLTGYGAVIAARMAVEELGGRVHGTPVEVIFADHQNKADIGAGIAREWIDSEEVDAIVDVPTSSVALAVNEIVRDRNKVLLVSGAGTSRLTGDACSPNTVHWTYDNWALANGTGRAVVELGGETWFFLTADYAFGHDLEAQTARVVEEMGGRVLGAVRHPLSTADFSSYLLQAKGSGAEVIGLANAGGDTTNAIKQAVEFGITASGQRLVPLLIGLHDVESLGLQTSQGLLFTEGFYWDLNEDTRAFSERFAARNQGKPPSQAQAGVYGAVLHYLKAVQAAGTDAGAQVVAQMKSLPTSDPLFGEGHVRPDGRMIHEMYLVEAKSPSESKGRWDLYEVVRTIPAREAFRPLAEGGCPLVKG
jgi:branched-chain amino acid transport system substrate-binding protein